MSRPRLIGWLLVLLTLLAYLPVLCDGFLNFDDNQYVTENQVVQQGLSWPGVQWAFNSWHASNWHPVTWLSHMADCELFRLNPVGHHLVNLLFHAANAWLLFLLWRRLTAALWGSAMVAALFAWHPLHVESVAWVSERKDVLCTFFALLSLLAYARYVAQSPELAGSNPAERSPSVLRRPSSILRFPFPPSVSYFLALLFFALALMSKPMAVTLPFVMLLLDVWPLARVARSPGGSMVPVGASPHRLESSALPLSRTVPNLDVWRSLLLEKWPFFLLTLAGCVVTVLAQRAEAIAPLAKYSIGLRLENAVTAYADYLYKMIWPAHLAVFYPLLQPGWLAVALATAVLLAISALVAWRARFQPYLAIGWLW